MAVRKQFEITTLMPLERWATSKARGFGRRELAALEMWTKRNGTIHQFRSICQCPGAGGDHNFGMHVGVVWAVGLGAISSCLGLPRRVLDPSGFGHLASCSRKVAWRQTNDKNKRKCAKTYPSRWLPSELISACGRVLGVQLRFAVGTPQRGSREHHEPRCLLEVPLTDLSGRSARAPPIISMYFSRYLARRRRRTGMATAFNDDGNRSRPRRRRRRQTTTTWTAATTAKATKDDDNDYDYDCD
eukprot:9488731-Pyramimonas_sp.AAC.1